MSGIILASNTSASKAASYISKYQQAVNQSVQRLSSGKKINSASDSPGETGYVNRLRASIMSYKALNDNIQDNMSMLQTADYAISGSGGIAGIIQAVREKTVQAQNSALTSQDRQNLQEEIEDLVDELDDIATSTEFNTKKLLNGEMGAKLTSSDSALAGYATDIVSSGSFHFTDILGATRHELQAASAPSGTADITGADYDYSASAGTSGSVTLDGGTAGSDGDYEVVFTGSSDFDVYNNSTGTVTASGSAGTEFTLDGVGITFGSDGDYAEGYKYNFSLSAGNTALINAEEGNRGLSGNTSLASADWGSDAMINSYFDIKFQYDGGALKYAAFDSEGSRMGSWVESGEEFSAYSSSKLNGSTFTFTSADAGIGDTWRVQFANYDSVQSSGGTLTIGNSEGSFSVSYTGDDRLSDIVSAVNSNGSGVAEAELDDSGGSSILTVTAEEYGERFRLSITDTSGNLSSALGMAETENSGRDASLLYSSAEHTSETGYFYDIGENLVIEVADDADVSSGYVSVSDTSVSQATNINGPDGVTYFIRDLTAQGLGFVRADGSYAFDVTTSAGASDTAALADSAADIVDAEAARVGSLINSLDYHSSFLGDIESEYSANLSVHEDTDFAEETTDYYSALVGRDAAAAMTAQANLQPSRVLQLLGLTS